MLKSFSRIETILYGPVQSRRFGSSLGINLFPGTKKVCSFDCRYCQLGAGKPVSLASELPESLPTPLQVQTELEKYFNELPQKRSDCNCLTFSGNGEATLHPQFGEMAKVVKDIRDRLAPKTRTVILTNGTQLLRPDVAASLCFFDDVVVKLDAGTEEMFQKINQPAKNIRLSDIVKAIGVVFNPMIQTLFVTGAVDNTTEKEIQAWLKVVSELRPKQVQIHTLDRIPADGSLTPVSLSKLEEIGTRVRKEIGSVYTVFGSGVS